MLAVPGHLEGVVDHQDGARELGGLGRLLVAFMVLARVVDVILRTGFGLVIIIMVGVHDDKGNGYIQQGNARECFDR